MAENGRKAVTWPQMIGVLASLIALGSGALALHASHPHSDSVHLRELQQMERRFDSHFDSIQRQLQDIKESIR